jgi:hypothetical protein
MHGPTCIFWANLTPSSRRLPMGLYNLLNFLMNDPDKTGALGPEEAYMMFRRRSGCTEP